MFFSHFNRVKMSDATPFDLNFEISNSDPVLLPCACLVVAVLRHTQDGVENMSSKKPISVICLRCVM